MRPTWDELRQLLLSRSAGVAVLSALTVLRLLTDGGLGGTLATEVYLLAVAGFGVACCLPALVRAMSAERRPRLPVARPNFGERPERLEIFEDLLARGAASAIVREYHLRPMFRTLVSGRLARAGIDLDTDPRARSLLGETAWWLAQPVRRELRPDDGPGLDAEQVRELTRAVHLLGTEIAAQTGVRH